MNPIEFSHVWKRYRIGSKHDSLRDAIPALLKRLSGRNGRALSSARHSLAGKDRAGSVGHALRSDEFWALQDVSFEAKKGETLGIIGPNGAGKSTALKLLSRISKQTSGDIRVNGRLAALIEVGAGFHPDLTGRENIYLNGTILGLRKRQIDRLFDSIVEFSELEKFLDMPVKRYSSGMTVRLGFAIAAHTSPENLLVDEVLAVGDLSFQQKCYQRILDLKARGTTIIFISHNLEAVQRLCDRVLLLNEGQIVREGESQEVIEHYRHEVLRYRKSARELSPAASSVSRPIEVVRVAIEDGKGRPREIFETGALMRLRVHYRTSRPVRNPCLTVTIERLDGVICHEASTRQSGLAWDVWQGQGEVVLDYPTLNLLPNTYQVICSVFEEESLSPLTATRGIVYFHVTSDRRTRGMIHLDHEWQTDVIRVSSSERRE